MSEAKRKGLAALVDRVTKLEERVGEALERLDDLQYGGQAAGTEDVEGDCPEDCPHCAAEDHSDFLAGLRTRAESAQIAIDDLINYIEE